MGLADAELWRASLVLCRNDDGTAQPLIDNPVSYHGWASGLNFVYAKQTGFSVTYADASDRDISYIENPFHSLPILREYHSRVCDVADDCSDLDEGIT